MQYSLIKIGRVKQEAVPLVNKYQKRLSRMLDISYLSFKTDAKALEWAQKSKSRHKVMLVILDEHGKNLSSTDLSKQIQKIQDDPSCPHIAFIIGDPHGLSEQWRSYSSLTWSLSNATFPADLAWVLLHEQLYRASCLNSGIPYHHE